MITIIGTIIGVICGALLTYFLDKRKREVEERKITKQILEIINSEVKYNTNNNLKSNFRYRPFNLIGKDLLILKTGALNISTEQLDSLTKIYGYFSNINDGIDMYFKLGQARADAGDQLNNKIDDWRDTCRKEIDNYLSDYIEGKK